MAWTSADLAAHYRNQGKEPPPEFADGKALREKVSKYRSQKTALDGVTFHSALECEAYRILTLWATAGAISDLRLQPSFTIQEGFTRPTGERVKPIRYSADFRFFDEQTRKIRYVDAKGKLTQAFLKSMKQMKDKFPDVEIELWDRDRVKEMSRV